MCFALYYKFVFSLQMDDSAGRKNMYLQYKKINNTQLQKHICTFYQYVILHSQLSISHELFKLFTLLSVTILLNVSAASQAAVCCVFTFCAYQAVFFINFNFCHFNLYFCVIWICAYPRLIQIFFLIACVFIGCISTPRCSANYIGSEAQAVSYNCSYVTL